MVFNQKKTTSFYDLSFFGQVDRSYLKVSLGDRFGTLDLTGLQHGFYLNPYLGARVGLFNYKPGFGFDLHPFQKFQLNLDVYNPNVVDVDLFAKYKIYDPLSLKLGVVNDLVTRKWNNFLFGLNFGL